MCNIYIQYQVEITLLIRAYAIRGRLPNKTWLSLESFPLRIFVQRLYVSATRVSSHGFGLHHAVVLTLRMIY